MAIAVLVVLLLSLSGCAVAFWRQRQALGGARADVARVWERGLTRFTESADLLPDILVELDANQVLTFTNRAFTRLCGYSDHDLRIGMSLADLLVPEQRPRLACALDAARGGEPTRAYSFHLRRRDGDVRPVALYLRAVVQGGRFRGWRGLLRDLQENQHDLDRPRASHRAAEAVIRAILKDFARTTAERHEDVVGRALASAGAYLGVDRAYIYREGPGDERLEGRHLWYADGVTPLAGDQSAPPLSTYPWANDCFRNGASLRVPDVSRLPEAAVAERSAWMSQGVSALMAVPLRRGERVIGFLGCEVFGEPRQWDERDLDVLETIAEICQQLSVRLPRLGELLPDPAFVVDTAGVVVAWNAALASLTGLDPSDWLGATLADASAAILGPAARPLPVQGLLAAPEVADAPLELVVGISRQEQDTYLRLIARPLHDETGRLLGAVQIIQDVTPAALAERHLRRRLREAQRGQQLAREESRRLREALEAHRYPAARRDAAGEAAN